MGLRLRVSKSVRYSRIMSARTPTRARRLVSLPVSLDQLAFSIERLSPDDLEALELSFDPRERKEILRRGKAVRGLARRGKTLTLPDLQAEFGVK